MSHLLATFGNVGTIRAEHNKVSYDVLLGIFGLCATCCSYFFFVFLENNRAAFLSIFSFSLFFFHPGCRSRPLRRSGPDREGEKRIQRNKQLPLWHYVHLTHIYKVWTAYFNLFIYIFYVVLCFQWLNVSASQVICHFGILGVFHHHL